MMNEALTVAFAAKFHDPDDTPWMGHSTVAEDCFECSAAIEVAAEVAKALAARAAAPVEAGLAERVAALHGVTHWCFDFDGESEYVFEPGGQNWPCPTRALLRPAPAADGGEPPHLAAWSGNWRDEDNRPVICPTCGMDEYGSLHDRPTPTDQNAAESSGSDHEAEVGRDE